MVLFVLFVFTNFNLAYLLVCLILLSFHLCHYWHLLRCSRWILLQEQLTSKALLHYYYFAKVTKKIGKFNLILNTTQICIKISRISTKLYGKKLNWKFHFYYYFRIQIKISICGTIFNMQYLQYANNKNLAHFLKNYLE